jgi:serine/threonine-protein kinase
MRGSMAGDGEFRKLGPFVLLRTSGAGGMGRIDLALRPRPGGAAQLCVVKRMHAELRSDEQDARFRREASIALQLSHDAIARTVGVEEIDGELVLLQELVHGVDLKLLGARVAAAGARIPLPIAVHIVCEVAQALAHAHAFGGLGIVHRDVTPDNVMLAFSGEVKLVDFGIARSNIDATLTSAGQIVGRPAYTAPEVCEGALADRRADIYSLGVVLWQLLTGRRLESARAGGGKPAPAPSAVNPAVGSDLDAVALRALASDPDDRYQTAGELQDALRPFIPAGFLAGSALAALLGRHFDVARERRMLADDVARAQRYLDGGGGDDAPTAPTRSRATVPGPDVTAPTMPTAARRPAVAAGVGVALLVSFAVISALKQSRAVPVAGVRPAAPAAAGIADVVSRPPLVPAEAPHVRKIATSAGRARPQGANIARPTAASPSTEELLRRAQESFDVGETEAALALARQAASAGARAPAHVLMGEVMMSERRYDEAEQEFAQAVRLDPGDAKAASMLALVRETRSGGR